MRPTVYIETSIISYLTARPSRDVIQIARQELTRTWWADRARYDVFVSDLVIQEASAGDIGAAERRLEALRSATVLGVSAEALALGQELLDRAALPSKARTDALHVAVAVVNGMEYLLSWNCAHIANATMRGRIEAVCRAMGFNPPIICTPEELTEE